MTVFFEVSKWLLGLILFGLIGLPFVFRFLKSLPGRGFAFARVFGLLIVSYLYWISCTLGIITNSMGGLILILFCAIILAFLTAKPVWRELLSWLKTNIRYCLFTEAVYLIGFGLILLFRLCGPDVSGTEKPMEMMFINSILTSDTFPPHDSWLSGYAISYYYFGYVISAILIMLSGVPSAVGFNLMLATVFSLAAEGAFALVNDLLNAKRVKEEGLKRFSGALLAPVFVLLAGNLEGLFETLHSLGLFWKGDGTSAFWKWIDLQELTSAPTRPATLDITTRGGIWWWRASRVLTDYTASGSTKEVIDEIPIFSFQLGDLHPHVLDIPFVIFGIAVALNLLLHLLKQTNRAPFFIEGILKDDITLKETALVRSVCSPEFWFTALSLGALIFINTWDFPFYYGLYCLTGTLVYCRRNGWDRSVITVFFEDAVSLGLACILLYGLFLTSLSSQAGGIAPSGLFVTRPIHFLIMFGFFFFPILWGLLRVIKGCGKESKCFGARVSGSIFAVLASLECLIFLLLLFVNAKGFGGTLGLAASSFCNLQQITDFAEGVKLFFTRRMFAFPTLGFLFGAVICVFTMVWEYTGKKITVFNDIDVFTGLMILIGTALIIFLEFFYLRDFFGTRMNTVFKFYYQAWILLALSAAYCTCELFSHLPKVKKTVFTLIFSLLFASSLIYPFWCVQEKITRFPSDPGLNGDAWLKRSRPDEWAGIEWLKQADYGIVLEKVGASYSADNSASVFSGYPTVQGPANHESQWRGGYAEMGNRAADVQQIYESRSWEAAEDLLNRYHVRYVYIGSAERSAYNVQENKFKQHLPAAFQSENCTIYQVY